MAEQERPLSDRFIWGKDDYILRKKGEKPKPKATKEALRIVEEESKRRDETEVS